MNSSLSGLRACGFRPKNNWNKDELVRIRKDFHRFPELGFMEYWTAEKVAEYIKNLGLEVQTSIGETGVVGFLRGKEAQLTLGIRACLDALLMNEYASENKGVLRSQPERPIN